ncbi:hypothetical protein C8R44DRAFT_883671 [Mycena epipterygia]|nr:hypothetical protein C8R44DRAFT_883671 [Mycena epipterygia]
MSHSTQIEYNRLAHLFPSQVKEGQSFLQYALHTKWKLNQQLFGERAAEIRGRKECQDRYRITAALNNGSTKRLITPGEFIALPITVNELHSEKLVSDPDTPWLSTKSVLAIKQRVQNDPFAWPRHTSIADFRTLLREGTPRPAPGRDQWEKWLVKSLSDRALQIVLNLHNYIVMNSRFPGDLKDMWITMFHKRGLRTDLSNWHGLLISNFLANSISKITKNL